MNFKHDDIEREIRSTRRFAIGFMLVALFLKIALVCALIWGGAVLIMHFVG